MKVSWISLFTIELWVRPVGSTYPDLIVEALLYLSLFLALALHENNKFAFLSGLKPLKELKLYFEFVFLYIKYLAFYFALAITIGSCPQDCLRVEVSSDLSVSFVLFKVKTEGPDVFNFYNWKIEWYYLSCTFYISI